MDRSDRRLYLAVALCAIVPYLPALWNGFAMDDPYIIVWNPLVHSLGGMLRAFGAPYWPPDLGGAMYRPIPVASYAIDWAIARGDPAWFHALNLLWHAAVAVSVVALARRWAGATPAFIAGLLFAVHPVHVEAVANVIGRAELMAALGACLSVYAAVVYDSILWSAAALAFGVLSKENAAVAPALIVWAWMLRINRPSRSRAVRFGLAWLLVFVLYAPLRIIVLHPYERLLSTAPVFVGENLLTVRLTAISALTDVARLLVFPLTLRADYSPAERVAVRTPLDGRFLLGLLAVVIWALLMRFFWRRGRRMETYGLGWIAIAFLPIANLLYPSGVYVAERTLYLPSVGLALVAGGVLSHLPERRVWAVALLLVVAGAARSALRTPVWRDNLAVTGSILEDSPNSYRGPARMAVIYLSHRQPERSLAAVRVANRTFDRDPAVFITGADAAFTLGQPRLADSMLARLEQLCYRCPGYYRIQAGAARARGDSATADSLAARIP